jgi:ketosteroid isomerase-like protein
MSSPNVVLVRSIYAAWERGDLSSVEWAHPEIEVVFADGPAPGGWSGLTGIAEGFRDFLSAWQDFHPEAEKYRELDDEHVLVLQRYRGRGKTSGLDVGQMRALGTALFHVRDGRVTRLVTYWNRERGLADLGLAPDTGSS